MKLIDSILRQPARVAFGRSSETSDGSVNVVALDSTRDADSITITADDGSFVVLPGTTDQTAGILTVADKQALGAAAGRHYDSRAAVETASIPPECGAIRTAGYAAPGDGGGALYRRVASAPDHAGAVRSADGAWWELVPTGEFIRISQFGAQDGGDITTALQSAIDFAMYGGPDLRTKGHAVLIDVEEGTISNHIQIGYGTGRLSAAVFPSLTVKGLGKNHAAHEGGTTLFSTVTDRMTFAVTGGRAVRLMDFTLIGIARDEIKFGMNYDDPVEPTIEANWDAQLSTAGVVTGRRYAPHAAIAIDPYAGSEPADPYPAVSCPSWIDPEFTTYGKGGSQNTTLENLYIEGFEVGVVQTPADHDFNGDFLLLEHVRIDNCKYGVSVGNTQSRMVGMNHGMFITVWCCVTNNTHGRQNGTFGGRMNFGGANFIGYLFIFDNLTRAGTTVFDKLDIESLHKIGRVVSGASASTELVFRQASLRFRHTLTSGVPAYVIEGVGNGRIAFEGGEFRQETVLSFEPQEIEIRGTRVRTQVTRSKTYEKIGHNATMGLMMKTLGAPTQAPMLLPFNLDTGSQEFDPSTVDERYNRTGREYCTPIWAGSVRYPDHKRQFSTSGRRPTYYNRISDTRRSGFSRSGRTVTFTTDVVGGSEQGAQQQGLMPGDVLMCENTGTVMFIRSTTINASDLTVAAEMQNNCYTTDGGATWELFDGAFDGSGFWVATCGRYYLPFRPMLAAIASGSSEIAVYNSIGVAPNYGLAVGDWLSEEILPIRAFDGDGDAKISAIDIVGDTITLGGTPGMSIDPFPLDWWVRAAPPNEASR